MFLVWSPFFFPQEIFDQDGVWPEDFENALEAPFLEHLNITLDGGSGLPALRTVHKDIEDVSLEDVGFGVNAEYHRSPDGLEHCEG